jgi:hypothetical protein
MRSGSGIHWDIQPAADKSIFGTRDFSFSKLFILAYKIFPILQYLLVRRFELKPQAKPTSRHWCINFGIM